MQKIPKKLGPRRTESPGYVIRKDNHFALSRLGPGHLISDRGGKIPLFSISSNLNWVICDFIQLASKVFFEVSFFVILPFLPLGPMPTVFFPMVKEENLFLHIC